MLVQISYAIEPTRAVWNINRICDSLEDAKANFEKEFGGQKMYRFISAKQVLELEDTINPICPYCGKEMRDAWELYLNDGDETEVDCPYCEEPYIVQCNVSVSYSTRNLK